MIYHIVQGSRNGANIAETLHLRKELTGELLIIEDSFSFGPLRDEHVPFDQLRNQYWTEIQASIGIKQPTSLQVLEKLTLLINKVQMEQDEIWYWMGSSPDDLITYYFLLHYLKKFNTIFKIININGLPFLDNELKLFYPKSFAELPSKEIIKSRKLARLLSPSEWEADVDEWKYIVSNQNYPIRLYMGGKKIEFKELEWAENLIMNNIESNAIKISKLLSKINPIAEPWRQVFYHGLLLNLQHQQKIKIDQQMISNVT